jgi:hypothetical protein
MPRERRSFRERHTSCKCVREERVSKVVQSDSLVPITVWPSRITGADGAEHVAARLRLPCQSRAFV